MSLQINPINSVENNDLWFRNLASSSSAQWRLFCFPYAGGSATIFRGWPGGLPAEIAVCPIQLPGRENRFREAPFTNFDQLVTVLSEVLQPHVKAPCAFFGHSMGALLAFEVARRLAPQSNLRQVFVSGSSAPQFVRESDTYKLPKDALVARLRDMGGTPEEVLQNQELLDLLLPTIRADFQLLASYKYHPGLPLTCPIRVFTGENDRQIDNTHLTDWQAQTTQPLNLKIFPGNHFFIHSQQSQILTEVTRQLFSSQKI